MSTARPIYAIVELVRKDSCLDAFHGHSNTTINTGLYEERCTDPEWPSRDEMLDSCIVESCQAEWPHPTARSEHDRPFYVRCMEPSMYYLEVEGHVIVESRYFCELHKPRVRPL